MPSDVTAWPSAQSWSFHYAATRRFPEDRCLARLGPGARRNARLAAAHPFTDVALFRLADRRAPWRGVAQEGRAQLAVAVPTSPSFPFWMRKEC